MSLKRQVVMVQFLSIKIVLHFFSFCSVFQKLPFFLCHPVLQKMKYFTRNGILLHKNNLHKKGFCINKKRCNINRTKYGKAMKNILAIVYYRVWLCCLLVLQQVQPVFLYCALSYVPATNRNIRMWLVHVSSRTDLSIKETLLVKRRRRIQLLRKTVRKTDGLVT